jgi:hypothetical protein
MVTQDHRPEHIRPIAEPTGHPGLALKQLTTDRQGLSKEDNQH